MRQSDDGLEQSLENTKRCSTCKSRVQIVSEMGRKEDPTV